MAVRPEKHQQKIDRVKPFLSEDEMAVYTKTFDVEADHVAWAEKVKKREIELLRAQALLQEAQRAERVAATNKDQAAHIRSRLETSVRSRKRTASRTGASAYVPVMKKPSLSLTDAFSRAASGTIVKPPYFETPEL